ncbi:MAG: HAD family hydrolase [Acidimicrobiia bacterium]
MATPPEQKIDTLLLDVGGVFLLPSHGPIVGALERAEIPVDAARLDRAHYAGAASYPVDVLDVVDDEAPLDEFWRAYLTAFISECGVPSDRTEQAIEHLGSEFATDGLWKRIAPGSVDALRTIDATGIRMGIVSNAGGTMDARLRDLEILQVGPGVGVEVGTLIDSGAVGVEKPDPRIFRLALDALDADPDHTAYVGDMPLFDVVGARRAGLRPLLMDPFGFQDRVTCERITSLADVVPLLNG